MLMMQVLITYEKKNFTVCETVVKIIVIINTWIAEIQGHGGKI